MALGRIWWLTGVYVVATAVACSSFGGNDETAGAPGGSFSDGGFFFGSGGATGSPGPGFGAANGSGGAPLPPEKEVSAAFELPHAGENFVYAANTDSDTVAVIDARNLGIQIVQAGDKPRFLQTLAHSDAAIVLNVGSFDATIIRTDSATGASVSSSVLVKPGSNAIAVADDARHAVVYFDSAAAQVSSTPGNPQDVTVITLNPDGDTYNGMSIGYGASRVFFSKDSARAFVVTDDGVSILDFADIDQKANGENQKGSGIARTVPLGKTGIDQTLDVSVTSDGRYALAREEGTSELRLVDLDTGEIQKLDLEPLVPVERPDGGAQDSGAPPSGDSGAPTGSRDGGPDTGIDGGRDSGPPPTSPPSPGPSPSAPATITDLDLAPSGAFAMAVLRERNAVAKIPIPTAFTDPSSVSVTRVPNELVGSVTLAPDETHALLYTTVVDSVKRVTILDLAGDKAAVTVQLKKSVESVAIAPDSETALILNKKLPGDPNDPAIDDATRADRQFGYTLLQLSSGFVKLQVTAAPLGPFAIVPDGSHLLLLFNQAPIREVQNVDLTSFQMTPIELGSPPTSVGAVPGSQRAFVGQDHPDGRISFIDWATSTIQTVTGFELNSRIRQ